MGEKKRRLEMWNEKTYKTHVNLCLHCGMVIDAATPAGHKRMPKEGSIAICLDCHHIMAFDAQLKLRGLTDAEMRMVAGDPYLLRVLGVMDEARTLFRRTNNAKEKEN